LFDQRGLFLRPDLHFAGRRAQAGSRIAFAEGKSDRAAARSVLDAAEHGGSMDRERVDDEARTIRGMKK